ncbi:multidrug ABC transporter substrate-binding protein [Hyphomicrobium nitrativorans NL23]|uniref:Multidrug ABC transporter substrate-binding protein n=1 Tax=Hyphomicrobium nitrativorans NL23 TaxID=1029756 RepID=V5SHM2_9HYPH|nr:lipoprotein-releasing ABC transporter permease subunit [Hyphomicrobium nitrativorans]AHB49555.1 multidrug ABC transporter substrate-binding protein [Hyphomicrobium nitrativorans NL23]
MAASVDTKPFAPFEWLLASRYLRARRKEGFISVTAVVSFLGIMLGVATLIIVMAVMNGFRKDLFAKILGLNGHIVVYKVGAPFDDYLSMAEIVARAQGVERAIPLIEGQVMVSSPVQALGAAVRGIAENDLKSLPLVADNIRYGTLDGFDNSGGIAVGIRLANMLRLNEGDMITIISPRGAATPFGTAPRSKSYPITAIFELGMAEYDKTMMFLPLEEAQRYFSKVGEVDILEVIVSDPEAVDAASAAIRAEAGQTINVTDWRQRNETFFTVLEVERNVMFIILSLIVLVAALNIISGMMMLVKEKGRDIAILRTMGATKGAVMRVFLITGASIGIVGTLAGLVLGVVFCMHIEEIRQFVTWIAGTKVFDPNVYYLTRLPAEINPVETGSIVAMALALSVLATLYPSWRASRLDPVEALRYE